MTARKRGRRIFFLWSVSCTLLFLLIGDGTSKDATVPTSFSAPAARPANYDKAPTVSKNSSDKKDNCLDGTDSISSHSAKIDEDATKTRQQQQTLHDSFASWITGAQSIYTLLYIETFQYDQSTLSESLPSPTPTIVRGLAASRNIDKGELVLSIPFNAIISLDSIDKDPILSNILGQKERQHHGWYDEMQLLIVFLLYHKSLGPSSPVHPYLQILQSAPTDQMPFMWTKETLYKMFPNPTNGVRIATELIHNDVQVMYEEIIPVLVRLHPSTFAMPQKKDQATPTDIDEDLQPFSDGSKWNYSYENFLWAFAMVNSRHWRLPCQDLDHISSKTQLSSSVEVVSTDVPAVNEEVTVSQAPLPPQPKVEEDGRVLSPSSPSSALLSSSPPDSDANDDNDRTVKIDTGEPRSHTFLLPFADLLNFGKPCTRGEYNAQKHAFEVTATCDIKKGEEVTFWYTDECSDVVLANFGFTHSLIQNCKTLEEWKIYSVHLEGKVEKLELLLTETQEYVKHLNIALDDAETRLQQCQDLIGLNSVHRQKLNRNDLQHPHKRDNDSDEPGEPPLLDSIMEGHKLRSGIRRAGQQPFDDNL